MHANIYYWRYLAFRACYDTNIFLARHWADRRMAWPRRDAVR